MPAAAMSAASASAVARSAASGFSTKSGRPCSRATRSRSPWANGGTHTYRASGRTASTSVRASGNAPAPDATATRRARSPSWSATPTTSAPARPVSTRACRSPTPPAPTIPMRTCRSRPMSDVFPVRGGPAAHVSGGDMGVDPGEPWERRPEMLDEVGRWFRDRTFAGWTWSADDLARRLLDQDDPPRVSVVLPARNEQETVGSIVETLVTDLVQEVPLVDEVVVMDSRSTDRTAAVARAAGARVVPVDAVVPAGIAAGGKGEALWASLLVTDGDLLVFLDADLQDFTS